jgi:Ca-activated chloride channel family protein
MTPVLALDFISPQRLWLLLAVAALAGAYVALQWRRRHYAVRFTNVALLDKVAPKRPGWRRHLVAALFLATGALQVVAFAGPQKESRIPRERATVILAIDTSLSMDATDVDPSRIEGAKQAAISFVETVPPKINIGLVSFSGRAIILVPPSLDRDRVRTAISTLTLGNGTAIGDAILSSLEALKAAPPDEQGTQPPAAVVLLSDGKTTVGTPDSEAARIAAEAKVPVSTIAFGTQDGRIRSPDTGTFIAVPVDEEALQKIADTTGGSFFGAKSTDELKSIYSNIGSAVGYEKAPREITRYFVGLAMLAGLMTAALSLAWFQRLP